MEKMNKPFRETPTACVSPNFGFDDPASLPGVHITDRRIARLLVVLQELDRSVAGLEELPKAELSELVSDAILQCGFVDPIEARYAIAAVLEAIEMPGALSESS